MQKKYNYLIIFAAISILYLPTVFYEFVWDDLILIINNTASHSLTNFFTALKDYPLTTNKQLISRPLTIFTFACTFTESNSAWLFHLVNITIHALNICLLYKLLSYFKTTSDKHRLGLCLIYGILPIHAGAVTYIAGRSELVGSFFILCSLINFIIFFQNRTIRNLTISAFLTMIACFAKETAVTVIFLTSTYTLLYENKNKKIINTIKYSIIPYSLSILPYTIWHIVYSLHPSHIKVESMQTLNDISVFLRLWIFIKNIPVYLNLLLNPLADIFIEVSRQITLYFSSDATLPIITVCVFALLGYKNFKNKNFQNIFFLIWFFCALLPYSNIVVPTMLHPKAHFLYIPGIGLIFIIFNYVAGSLTKYQKKYKYFFPLLLAAVLLLLSFRTSYINTKWKDPESLYSYNLKQNPEKIHFNMGLLFMQKQNYKQAEMHIKKSISFSLADIKNNYNRLLQFYITDEKTTKRIQDQIENKSLFPVCLNKIKTNTQSNIFIHKKEEKLKAELHKNIHVTFLQLKASLLTLSSCYIAQQEYKKAKDITSGILTMNVEDHNDYGLFYNLGFIAERQNNYTDAKKYYTKSLVLKKDYNLAAEGLKRVKN